MTKRNFILLIIILLITIILFFVFLNFRQPTTPTIKDTGGTNFFSQFNPFASSKPTTPINTNPPIEIPQDNPDDTTPVTVSKLTKISSMPVAGYTVYSKERIKEINPSLTLPLSW